MSEFKKLGHVSPTDGLGSGGASVKPGKVSDLLNPSTSQIPLYDPTKTYKNSEYVMVKEKNAYVIYQAVKDTTGTFDPSAWEKYTLGDTLSDIRNEMVESTNALMSAIVKGGGTSKSSTTSGILDWIPTETTQIASEYNPFLGFLGAGFATYNGIVVDGMVVEHDVTQTLDLQDVSPTGVSYELVFLEAYRVLESGLVTMKHRLRSFMLSEIDYLRAKKEGSYFLGLSKSRVRFVQSQGGNTSPLSEVSDPIVTSKAYRFATFLSSDERIASKGVTLGKYYAPDDKGLWVAGDGSDEAKEALGTADGYSFAIPLALLRRRNSSKGSTSNVNGGSDFVLLTTPGSLSFEPKGSGYITVSPLANTAKYLKAGMQFIKQGSDGSEVFEVAGVKDTFGRQLIRSLSTRATTIMSGTALVSTTTNPYNKYTNMIESTDVLIIQQTLTSQMNDFMGTLDSNFNKLMRGELLDSHEELISETFESENNSQTLTRTVSNLIPEVTDIGASLVNILSGIYGADDVFTKNNDIISPTVKRLADGSYDITAKVVQSNTSGVKKIVNFLSDLNFIDFTMDGNYLIAMDVKASTEIKLVNNNDESMLVQADAVTDGLFKAVKLKDTVLNNMTIETVAAKPIGTTITINISNIRMYNIGEITTVSKADEAKYPHVINVSKQAQNVFKLVEPYDYREDDGAILEYVSDTSCRFDIGSDPETLGYINGEACVLSMDITPPSYATTIDLYILSDKTKKITLSGKDVKSLNVIIPSSSTSIVIGGPSGQVYTLTNIQARPLFSTQSTFVPSGSWTNTVGDQSFVHRLRAFDRYRKVWSNKPSSTKVRRTIYPTQAENLQDIDLQSQIVPGKFSTADIVNFNGQNVIGPVVDETILANSSRIVNISGSVITLDNTTNLAVSDKVNIFNPDTMTLVVGNVTVKSVDSTTNAVTLNTTQPLKNGYLILETMETPFVPTTDSMVQASWSNINTKDPDMKIKNLTPPVVVNPFEDVSDNKMNKILSLSDTEGVDNPLSPVKWTSVSTGSGVTFAIDTEGQLWGWGTNGTQGLLGFPGVKKFSRASCIKGMTDCKQVSVGRSSTMVLKTDGSVWVCGDLSNIGTGLASSNRPAWEFTKVPLSDNVRIKRISARRSIISPVAIAFAENGDIYTCGEDTLVVPSASPTFVKYTSGLKDMSAMAGATFFIKEDGTLWGVGDGRSGIFLTSTTDNFTTPVAILPSVTNFKSIKTAPSATAVLTEDGKIYYWGTVVKNNGTSDIVGYTQAATLPGNNWTSVEVTNDTLIALKKDGTVWLLGVNTNSSIVYTITQITSNVSSISINSTGTVITIITSDGKIKTKGVNSDFTLAGGRRAMASSTSYAHVTFKDIEYNASRQVYRTFPRQFSWVDGQFPTVGYNHVAYIDLDGYLYTMGSNSKGQLGDGTTTTRNYPVKASVLGKCKDFAISQYLTVAIAEDGTLWCTGSPLNGATKLNGVTYIPNTWTQIDTNTDWERVECSTTAILGLRNNFVCCMSSNSSMGGLGMATTDSTLGYRFLNVLGASNMLRDVSKVAKIVKFGVSSYNGYILYDNGKIFGWGATDYGESLSSNTTVTIPSTPTVAFIRDNFIEDAHTNGRTVYLKVSGVWYGVGFGTTSYIPGSNSITNTTPVKINAPVEIYKILPACSGFYGLCYNGDIYYTGSGDRPNFTNVGSTLTLAPTTGMLGDGVIGAYMSPYSTFVETVNGLTGVGFNPNDNGVVASLLMVPQNTNPNMIHSKADYLSDYTHTSHHNKLFVSNNNTLVNYQDGTIWGAGKNNPVVFADSQNSSVINPTLYRLRQTRVDITGKVRKISAGDTNLFILYEDGRVYVSGSNAKGLLWTKSTDTTVRYTSYLLDLPSPALDIAVSGTTAFILLSDGSIQSVGSNTYGQCGQGTTTDVTVPAPIAAYPEGGWKSITTSGDMAFAITMKGVLHGWGNNQYGYFGSTNPMTTPYVLSPDTDWVSVEAGVNFAIAMKEDGSLWSIGRNNVGQCGQGGLTDVTTLTKIDSSNDWKQFACGAYHVIAVKKDNTLWSWGINDKEQQANKDTATSIRVPTRLGTAADWDYVCAGYRSSYAVKQNGEVYVWGDNQYGQLAIGSTIPSTSRMTLLTSRLYPLKYISMSAGESIMGITRNREIWGKGSNNLSRITIGNTTATLLPEMMKLNLSTTATPHPLDVAVAMYVTQSSFNHALVLFENGSLYGWADNAYSQFGTAATTSSTSITLLTSGVISAVAVGDSTFIFKADGVYSNGRNDATQLGIGDNPITGTPRLINSPETLIGIAKSSSPIAQTIFGWSKSGKVYATGLNTSGEMGISGDVTNKSTFTEVSNVNLINIIKVTTNNSFTVALREDGTLWGWGLNAGKVLDPSKAESVRITSAVQIKPLGLANAKVRDVHAQLKGLTVILEDGRVFSTGYVGNILFDGYWIGATIPYRATSLDGGSGTVLIQHEYGYALLGDNTYLQISPNGGVTHKSPFSIDSSAPIKIPEMIYADTSSKTGVGLDFYGTPYVWGDCSMFNLGQRKQAFIIARNLIFNTIAVSDYGSMAISNDGKLYTVGLGAGVCLPTATTRYTQVTLSNGDWGRDLSIFDKWGFAIKNDGQLYSWGSNVDGAIGLDEYTTTAYTPNMVEGMTNVSKVYARGHLAIKDDGSLWATTDLPTGVTANHAFQNIFVGTKWKSIAKNSSFVDGQVFLGVQTDGTLWAYGLNNVKSLVKIGTSINWISCAVSRDGKSYRALNSEGRVYVFGLSKNGSLSLGSTDAVQIDTLQMLPLTHVQSITGDTNPIYVTSKFELLISGSNVNGLVAPDLNESYVSYDLSPIYQNPYMKGFKKVLKSYSGGDIIILKEDGTIWGMGTNAKGILGVGHTRKITRLTQLNTRADWKDICMTNGTVYGLTASGELYAWGDNTKSQFGIGVIDTSDVVPERLIPNYVSRGWAKIYASQTYNSVSANLVIGVKELDYSVYAWGEPTGCLTPNLVEESALDGEFKLRAHTSKPSFKAYSLSENGIDIDGGFAVVSKPEGLYYIGTPDSKQVVENNIPSRASLVRGLIPNNGGVMIVPNSGIIMGTGKNISSVLVGDTVANGGVISGWQTFRTDIKFIKVVTTRTRATNILAYGLAVDNTLYIWGYRDGVTTPVASSTGVYSGPGPLIPAVPKILDIELTDSGTLYMLCEDNNIYAMGRVDGYIRGLSSNTTTNVLYTAPAKVPTVGTLKIKKMTASDDHLMVLGADNNIYAIGSNAYKQIDSFDDAAYNNYLKPIEYGEYLDIATSDKITVGINSGGYLVTWGVSYLVDGTETLLTEPAGLSADTDWVELYFKNRVLFAKKSNKTVWALGYNVFGNLGIGSSEKVVTTLTEVPILKGARNIEVSAPLSVAETESGEIVTAGILGDAVTNTTFTKIAYAGLPNASLNTGTNAVRFVSQASLPTTSTPSVGVTRKGIIIQSEGDAQAYVNGPLAQKVLGSNYVEDAQAKSSFKSIPLSVEYKDPNGFLTGPGFFNQDAIYLKGANGDLYTTGTGKQHGIGDMEKVSGSELYKVVYNLKPTEPIPTINSMVYTGSHDTPYLLDVNSNIWVGNYGTSFDIDNKYRQTTYRVSIRNAKNVYTNGYSMIMEDIDGKFWAKGDNGNNQLGLGIDVKYAEDFVHFSGTWKKIIFGMSLRTIGIKSDNSIWYWGGKETTVPTKEVALSTRSSVSPIIDASVGKYHDLFLQENGNIIPYATSTNSNQYGALGVTTTGDTTPNTIYDIDSTTTMKTFKKVYAGWNVSFAIGTDNKLYTTGTNEWNTLGDPTVTTFRSKFTLVPIGPNGSSLVKNVHTTSMIAAVLTTTGEVYVAGGMDSDKLIIPVDPTPMFTKLITPNVDIIDVKVYGASIYLLDRGGNVYTRGENSNGQLGFYPYITTREWYKIPSQGVKSLIIPDNSVRYALTENNEVLAWGRIPTGFGKTAKEVPVDRPIGIGYQELYGRNAGLNRTVKSVDNVIVNDRTNHKGYSFTVRIPIPTATAYIDTIANKVVQTTVNDVDACTITKAGSLFGEYVDSTCFKQLFNISNDEALSYISKVKFTASLKAKATGAQVTSITDTNSTDIARTYTNISFDLVKDSAANPVAPLAMVKFVGVTDSNPVTLVDPAIEIVFTVPVKTNTIAYVPQVVDWNIEKSSRVSRPVNPFMLKRVYDNTNPNTIVKVNTLTKVTSEISNALYNRVADGKAAQVTFASTASDSDYLEVRLDLHNQLAITVADILNSISSVNVTASFKKDGAELPVDLVLTDGNTQRITRNSDGTYTLPVTKSTLLSTGVLILRIGTAKANEVIDVKVASMNFSYKEGYKATHFNVVYVNPVDGAIETLFPITNSSGEFDKISTYYRALPKLQPINQTSDMIVLAESDHVLVTDIGDITLVDQGEAPFKNPLSQFDYDYKDLLGVLGFDGLTFTGDSARVNVDSRIAIKNGILTGATQQRIVKDLGTNAVGISRMLVWYEGTVNMLISLIRTENGVLDTQSSRVTRYLVPIEGNIRMSEPPSTLRKTILNKKVWR